MNLNEFLNLPKKGKSPRERIKDKVRKLRKAVDITGGETEDLSEEGCCGKKTFKSKAEALAYNPGHNNKTHKPIRAYRCSNGKWHLSSMPLKKLKESKKNWQF